MHGMGVSQIIQGTIDYINDVIKDINSRGYVFTTEIPLLIGVSPRYRLEGLRSSAHPANTTKLSDETVHCRGILKYFTVIPRVQSVANVIIGSCFRTPIGTPMTGLKIF